MFFVLFVIFGLFVLFVPFAIIECGKVRILSYRHIKNVLPELLRQHFMQQSDIIYGMIS